MRLEEPHHAIRQRIVADRLAQCWKCDWGQMGPYSPFDVYMMRDGHIVSLVEIRTRRDCDHETYHGTLYIDLDKWFHLMQAEIGLQLPGLYVVAFTDGIWWLRVGTVRLNEYRLTYRGRTDRPQAKNDMSPVIEVPTSELRRVCSSDGVFDNDDGGPPPTVGNASRN